MKVATVFTVAVFKTVEGDSVAIRSDGLYSTIFGTDMSEWRHFGVTLPWCRCRFFHTDELLGVFTYEAF